MLFVLQACALTISLAICVLEGGSHASSVLSLPAAIKL